MGRILIDGNATLDLMDGELIVRNPLSQDTYYVPQSVKSARNGGLWNASGPRFWRFRRLSEKRLVLHHRWHRIRVGR
jgi:hypothetical protein